MSDNPEDDFVLGGGRPREVVIRQMSLQGMFTDVKLFLFDKYTSIVAFVEKHPKLKQLLGYVESIWNFLLATAGIFSIPFFISMLVIASGPSRYCSGALAYLFIIGIFSFFSSGYLINKSGLWQFLKEEYIARQAAKEREKAKKAGIELQPIPKSKPVEAVSIPRSSSNSKISALEAQMSSPVFKLVIFGVVLVNTIFLMIGFFFTLHVEASLPIESGIFRVAGIRGEDIEVEKEASGMIHIKAENIYDLAYGQGYVTAQNRLWEMEQRRLTFQGNLSSIVGPDALVVDKFFRTVGLYRASQSAYDRLNDTITRDTLIAYSKGVNAWIDQERVLPLEFIALGYETVKPWSPVDCIAMLKLMSYDLSMNFAMEVVRYQLQVGQGLTLDRINQIIATFPSDGTTILTDAEARAIPAPSSLLTSFVHHGVEDSVKFFDSSSSADAANEETLEEFYTMLRSEHLATSSHAASEPTKSFKSLASGRFGHPLSLLSKSFPRAPRQSNNWVVNGTFTKTGKPILANDPHLALTSPSTWLLMHLESPEYNAIGGTLPAAPFVVIGRNQRISWGMTNSGADAQDIYILQNSADNTKYYTNGKYLSYNIRTEIINVKGGSPVVLRVKDSVYGPVINDVTLKGVIPAGARPLALRWTALDPVDTSAVSSRLVGQAGNYNDFKNALKLYTGPSQNFIYSDVDGNIGYVMGGKIPVRARNHTGAFPVPGNGAYDWRGFIPFNSLPQVYNPARGYIVTANNQIANNAAFWLNNYNGGVLAVDYDDSYRADRITKLLLDALKKIATRTADDIDDGRLDVEDMAAIQLDQISGGANDLRKSVLPLLRPVTADGVKVLAKLNAWDGSMARGSMEATWFQLWANRLTTLTAAETGNYFIPYTTGNTEFLVTALSTTTSGDPACVAALQRSGVAFNSTSPVARAAACQRWAAMQLDQMLADLGSDSLSPNRWGIMNHEAKFKSLIFGDSTLGCLFNRGKLCGGDRWTVNVATPDSDGDMDVVEGPTYRQIVNMDDMDDSKFIHASGQSGNIFSSEFDSLLPLWSEGEYLTMATEGYAVDKKYKLRSSTSKEL